MSTTDTTDQEPRHQRASRLFDDLLFENPEVCSNCYARIRDHEHHGEAVDRLGTGNRPTETLVRSYDGEIGYDAESRDAYGARKQYRARTYCAECGSPSGRANGAHIRSLQGLRRCADRIVRRLHEQGRYPDTDALYRALEATKRDPEHQGKDREILAAAMYLAIERGGEATTPGRPRVDPYNRDGL